MKLAWDLALTDQRRAKGSEIVFEVTDDESDAMSAGARNTLESLTPGAGLFLHRKIFLKIVFVFSFRLIF